MPLAEASQFCHSCGGKVIKKRLSFKNLCAHVGETFFNYDNKFLSTFIDLFKKPEVVIDSYVQGTRNRYVNPIGFFGIILTLNGLNIFIINKFYKKYLDATDLVGNIDAANNEATKKIMALSTDISLEYASLFFSLLIPVAALVSLIVFYNKSYNYTEHVIVYLYSMSVYSLLSVVFGLSVLAIAPDYYFTFANVMYVFIVVYHCYILTRLFKLSIKQLTIKVLLFLIAFFIIYIGTSILVVFILFFTGTVNPQDFLPPK
ncbi:DUF3667 domain-containing protein [Subsaximicrobium wynnwilliamsii]|uniref:DUF3667 domain-containing protein n=1 Tax=Subsaximicrobium wynnwilliamsii TaxID=291179 RepID=UPI001678D8DA|nr:DUF3667 domain-containing protein [Subsaximicrobium wynnwilliamsii]